MSAAQLLLRRLVEQAGGADETGYILVIASEGLEDLPPRIPMPKGAYAVHQVATEIGLRHLLWTAQGAPLIAVLPEALAERIQQSPDLLRRARNQRVHALLVNDVLEVMLGVRVVGADSPEMQQLALEHVEKLGLALSRRTLPTVVDRRLLTELLVDVSVGEQVRTQEPAELLAAWVQAPPQWTPNVTALVTGALPTMHGDEGKVLAWALEAADVRMKLVIIHGAVLTVDEQDLPKPAWGEFWQASQSGVLQMDRRLLRRTLATMAEAALGVLGDAAAGLLAEADRLGRATLTPTQLQTSRVLPLAFVDRCYALARQAAAGQVVAPSDVAWLATHRAVDLHRADMEVLTALARLSRYLGQPAVSSADVLAQVVDYQRDGAFADVASVELRRAMAASGHYHDEADKVLQAVRDRRDAANLRFATTLAAGYEACLHKEGLTPLHRIWKRTVEPHWKHAPDARIYLVVLDGCSYPVFLELLFALAQDSAFPLGIRPDADGRVAGLPGLAPLPTVTSHARGAIFLGELPNDPLVAETVFRDQDEAKTDKARFRQNGALGSRTRRLFLKGDLGDGGQGLMAAVRDDAISVVAAVFNAVDDQIGSSNTGATVRLAPEDIVGFKASLKAAVESGRRILLTADHGHSLYVGKERRAGAGKAPRYVGLGGGESAPEGFAEIELAGLGGPPERRAFAWRTGAYLGNPQVGFHGGCGLEEMVVPLAWLERGGVAADEPGWWYGGGSVAAEPAPKLAAPPLLTPLPTEPPGASKAAQFDLLNPAARAESLPLSAAALAKLTTDQRTVLVLLKETGSARASELAARLQKNPGRLNGMMVALRRVLFSEGQTLFTDEVLPNGETLYRYVPPASDGGDN